jgi:hypothetical protein
MWAICRSDHGIEWDEFIRLTTAQYEALEERRKIRIRYDRFNTALVASVLINSHRGNRDPISPYDFLAGYEADPEDIERQKTRDSIKEGIAARLKKMMGSTAGEVKAECLAIIARLAANGVEDPEGLLREVYPDYEE